MKKMKSYLLYPLVLGCVCLVCGGTLATVNYFTKDTIQANVEKAANQAIYNVANKVNKKIDEAKGIKDVDPTVNESKPFIEKKKSLFMVGEDKQYLYYQLITNKGFSGKVIFGALVSPENKVIATEFIGGDEDGIGVSAAKALLISAKDPYVAGGEIKSGASANKTLPVIKEALDAALADAGNGSTSSFPKKGTAKEQLTYIWKNELKQSGALNATEATVPTFTIECTDASTVDSKLNFTFDGKDASFYVVSFTQINVGGMSDEGKFTAVVNETGIINFHIIKSQGMTSGVMKPLEKLCTVETPYVTTRADEVVQAGTTITSTLMQSAFELIINDFGGNK